MLGFENKKEDTFQEQIKQREEIWARINEITQSSPIMNLLAHKFGATTGLASLWVLADNNGDYERIERTYKLIGAKLADNKNAKDAFNLNDKMKCLTAFADNETGKQTDELIDYMVNTPAGNITEDVIKSKKEEIERIRKWVRTLNDEIEEVIKIIIRTKLSGIIDESLRSARDAS